MAKTPAGGASGDWTAGLIAILATVLIGAGIPVALYYTLYVPRTKTFAAEQKKLSDQKVREAELAIKSAKVTGYKNDAKVLATRLETAEEKFTPTGLMSQTVKRLADIAVSHNLLLRREHQVGGGPRDRVVREELRQPVMMADGLRGTRVSVVGQAAYHDICRFIAEIESQASGIGLAAVPPPKEGEPLPEKSKESTDADVMRSAVIVVESLSVQGDQNGGHRHNFELMLVVIERRNIADVGTR